MKKRACTHVQSLLPEIKAILAERKAQREIAEYHGFQDKQVLKNLLNERRKNAGWKQEFLKVRKEGRERFRAKRHCGGAGL